VAQLTTKPSAELPLKYQWLVQGALSYTLECTAATTSYDAADDGTAATEDSVTALRLGRYAPALAYSILMILISTVHASKALQLTE
jgi:hypothetical protein